MTLAVAVSFPWGRLANLRHPDSSGPLFRPAIIFASDSRWTTRGPVQSSHRDTGTKLFRLATNVGGIYAGDVVSGELCLGRLAHVLNTVTQPSRHIEGRAQRVFRHVYREAVPSGQRRRRRLSLVIGVFTSIGGPKLWSCESSHDFTPVPVENVCTIGMPKTGEAFKAWLAHETDSAFEHGSRIPLTVSEWAFRLVAVMHSHIVHPAIDETVGGSIQMATLDPTGWDEQTVAVRADGDDRWRLVSPAEGSLGLWTLGQHRPGSAQDHGVTSSERLVITRW